MLTLEGTWQNNTYMSAGEICGTLCEKAARELGLPAGIAIGSGVIDAYAGWIGTVGAKVDTEYGHADETHAANDVSQAFHRLAAVAGTSPASDILREQIDDKGAYELNALADGEPWAPEDWEA